MAGWKSWTALGFVVCSSAAAIGADCNIRIDDDGIFVDADDDDDFEDFWDDLFD